MNVSSVKLHRVAERKEFVIGIDASRSRSGGAVAHMQGVLDAVDPRFFGVKVVHLWAYDELLAAIEEKSWLIKHPVAETRHSIISQVIWQKFKLPRIARMIGVDVMFNTDAGSFNTFVPCITLSQDMLSFEPGEMQRYSLFSLARLRLEILRVTQLVRLRKSTVAVFLTKYASEVIGSQARLRNTCVIAHGIDDRFRIAGVNRRTFPLTGPINCLYVSNAALYKHQWHVIEAVARLRIGTGLDLRLRLIGGGVGVAQARIKDAIQKCDPGGAFVEQMPFVPNNRVAIELAETDLFIFASSCENLPITLLEAMASGLPIACSSRGPMPEILGTDAIYFNPEQPQSIADAIEKLVSDPYLRRRSIENALEKSESFTWLKCADKTWTTLVDAANME